MGVGAFGVAVDGDDDPNVGAIGEIVGFPVRIRLKGVQLFPRPTDGEIVLVLPTVLVPSPNMGIFLGSKDFDIAYGRHAFDGTRGRFRSRGSSR